MGNYTHQLMNKITGTKSAKVIMQGIDASGKTKILYYLKGKKDEKPIPTIGSNLEKIKYKNLEIDLYDVGGADKAKLVPWPENQIDTKGYIFVVDSSDKERIEDAKQLLELKMKEHEKKNVPLLVMANKQDIQGCLTPDEIAEKLQMEQYKQRIWKVQGTNAIDGDGLWDGINWLTDTINQGDL